mmetsp:Transcript_11941/g.24054  ORF Transcript_11941/g.24054 Transcript_11941/m.24054 type:complete len:533 (-) Transcript_11941:145-1743(-)
MNECKRCARIIVLSSLFSTALSLQCGYPSTFVINQYATPSSIHSPQASSHLPLQTHRHTTRARCVRLSSAKGAENEDDVSKSKKKIGISKHIQSAVKKFKARPGTYLLIPIIAAFVGWFTNYLAVQMIFYPVEFRGIPIWRRDGEPLGLLGWQGIVPAKTYKMSETMVNMVTTQLLNVEEVFRRLDPDIVASTLGPEVPKLMESIGEELVPLSWTQKAGRALFFSLPGRTKAAMDSANHRFLHDFTVSMQDNIGTLLNIKNCVINQMLQDRALLGQLFRKCGQAELDFLTNSGLWFGFMLGIIQMIVALFWENPWALSIGGAIVGLATNWLALKWIFEPVNPTKIGPFILQGQFLRRQQEVAKEFSSFFANNVLTSEKLWDSILNDPSTKSSFGLLFTNHLKKFANVLSGGVGFLLPGGILTKASSSALEKLPNHLHVLHPYVDKALGLQFTLRTQMEKMTSAKFERVLHPIFEEDELTLIIAGGFLGFAAGLVQQGIETGAAAKWVSKCKLKIKKLVSRLFSSSTAATDQS